MLVMVLFWPILTPKYEVPKLSTPKYVTPQKLTAKIEQNIQSTKCQISSLLQVNSLIITSVHV